MIEPSLHTAVLHTWELLLAEIKVAKAQNFNTKQKEPLQGQHKTQNTKWKHSTILDHNLIFHHCYNQHCITLPTLKATFTQVAKNTKRKTQNTQHDITTASHYMRSHRLQRRQNTKVDDNLIEQSRPEQALHHRSLFCRLFPNRSRPCSEGESLTEGALLGCAPRGE